MPTFEQLQNRNKLFTEFLARFVLEKVVDKENRFIEILDSHKDSKIKGHFTLNDVVNLDGYKAKSIFKKDDQKFKINNKEIAIEQIHFKKHIKESKGFEAKQETNLISFDDTSLANLKPILGTPDFKGNKSNKEWYDIDDFKSQDNTRSFIVGALQNLQSNNLIESDKNPKGLLNKQEFKILSQNLEATSLLNIIFSNNKDYAAAKDAKTSKLISKLPVEKIKTLTKNEIENIKKFDENQLGKLLELVGIEENKTSLEKSKNIAETLSNIHNAHLKKEEEEEEKAKKQKQTIELQNLKLLKPAPADKNRVVLWKEDETKKSPNPGWYTINDLDSNPNVIFLFGDNVPAKYRDSETAGGGGQAIVVRGEKIEFDRCEDIGDNFKNNSFKHGNAYGISTTALGKISDADFQKLMDIEFAPLEEFVKSGGKVVVPCQADGKHNLGRGLGDIKSDNNKLQIIQNKIDNLIKTGQQNANPNQAEEDLKKVLHTKLKQDIEFYLTNKGLPNFIKNKKEKKEQSKIDQKTVAKPVLDTSFLVSMCTIDRIDGFLKDFPQQNDEQNSECRSSTLINSNIPITLFNEDGGNKIGIVIDPKRSKIQHGEFFAYGTSAMVPQEIKKDKANLYHDGHTEQLSSKYSEKTGRIGRWTGIQFFATNYAKWDIGKEKDEKYTNKQRLTEGSLELFSKALNREYYYYKDKTEKKYKKKDQNELKEMRYNEVLVQQRGNKNPVNGIIINVSSMLKSQDKGKISSEERKKLLQIFEKNKNFNLHIYDRRNKNNQIIILNNTEAQNLLNFETLNEELISFSNDNKKESFFLVQPYIKSVDRIVQDIYKIEYGQYQKIDNKLSNNVSLVGAGIGKDSGATYIQVKIKDKFFEISAGDELRIRKAKEVKEQVTGRLDISKTNIVAEGENLINGKNKLEIEKFLEKENIKELFDNLEQELKKPVGSNAEELYQIYNPNFRPPVWSIKSCENKDLSETTKIYCDEGADKDEVIRLAREREPVNMVMDRHYDENSLQKNFGYKTSAYQNIYSESRKTPANIAVYTKTPVKWGEKETTANVINVIAPALDSKKQPDYKIFFDTKNNTDIFRKYLYAQHMESVFNKIFQAAVDNNNKEIILSGFGLGFFSSLCGEVAAQDGYKTGLKNSLKKFESNLLKRGIKISYNSYEANDTFPDGIIRSLTKNLRGEKIIGGIDEIVFKQNDENRLYVNAWDPHSFVGNGNEGDNSLDGWWGRMTAMGFLCSPLTNQHLLEKDKIKFVTNSQKLEKDKNNLEQTVKNFEAVPGLKEIINEEFDRLKAENNNISKDKKIITIPSDNFLKIKAKDIIVGKLIRQEILDFQQYIPRNDVTAASRANKREELGKIVAENSERVSEFIQGSAQEDAPEFLRPIFENLFGDKVTVLESTLTPLNNNQNIKISNPKIEPCALPDIGKIEGSDSQNFSEMIKNFEKKENSNGDNKFWFNKEGGGNEMLHFEKKLSLDFKGEEVAFTIKRFINENGIRKKDDFDVNFDKITKDEKTYELTAFILHSGSLSSGHYTAYIKERDDKWYCYNDSDRSEVSGKNLENAKKQAYVVKYSVEGCLLPPNQKTGTTGGNNRCWMNASLAFLGSLTTISNDNLFSKEQNDKLRNEILGNKEENKKETVIEKIKNSTIFQSSFDANQSNNTEDEKKALEEIVQKTVIDPNLRAAFLLYLNDNENNFFDATQNGGQLYDKRLVFNNYSAQTGNEVNPLIKKFTKEFTKQYLIFLFQKYGKCGFNFDDEVINTLLDQDFDSKINIFQNIEQNIIQDGIISSLEKESNEDSEKFTKKLHAFSQLVYDSCEKEEEDSKDLRKRIEKLRKHIPTYQKTENKNPETKPPSKFATKINSKIKITSKAEANPEIIKNLKSRIIIRAAIDNYLSKEQNKIGLDELKQIIEQNKEAINFFLNKTDYDKNIEQLNYDGKKCNITDITGGSDFIITKSSQTICKPSISFFTETVTDDKFDSDIIEFLVKNGANIECTTSSDQYNMNNSWINSAIANDDPDNKVLNYLNILKKLKGELPEKQAEELQVFLNKKDKDDKTPLFFQIAKKYCQDDAKDSINRKTKYEKHDQEVIGLLIDLGSYFAIAQDILLNTPLHLALIKRDYDTLEKIFNSERFKEDSETLLKMKNLDEKTPLECLKYPYSEVIKILNNYYGPGVNSGGGSQSIIETEDKWTENLILCEKLFEKTNTKTEKSTHIKKIEKAPGDNLNKINKANEIGHTPLILAITSSNINDAQYLAKNEEVDLTTQGEGGKTALHHLAIKENDNSSNNKEPLQDVANTIIIRAQTNSKKSEILNAQDNDGNTPLHYATLNCNLELIDKLIEGGASMKIKNNKQETPKLGPIINSQKSKPNPSAPYLGCGFKFDVLQDNSSMEISMKIDEIFSPELPRFFIPPNKSFLGGEKLKSLAELEITEINAGGKTINLTNLFSGKPVNQAIQELAGILHDCGDVIFKTKDNKKFGCSRNAQNIFVTKKCSTPEVQDYFKNSQITGIAYDPAKHGLNTPELINNFKKEISEKHLPEFTLDGEKSINSTPNSTPTGTPKKPISSQGLKNLEHQKNLFLLKD